MNQNRSSSGTHDELSIDIDVMEDVPARQRPDDTWQALGRALGEAQPSVIVSPYVAAPPTRHVPPITRATPSQARVPESLYPVELPAAPPAASMSAQLPTWPFDRSADASLSLHLPVRRPRALSAARWAVAGVTLVGGLLCVVALVLSRTGEEGSAPHAAAAVAPPAAETPLPERVKDQDGRASSAAANLDGTSWSKNVLGAGSGRPSADRGVSVDSLPLATVPRAPVRKPAKKR